MRKNLLLILLCLSSTSGAYANSGECKKLLITGSDEYQPIHWRDRANPSKIIGIGIELVEMAMKEVGVPVEAPYVGNWKRAQLTVKNGEVDVIQGAYMNDERKTYLEYTDTPFIIDRTVIFVKKGSTLSFKKNEDLIGLAGAAPLGNSYGQEFDTFAKEKLKIDWTTSTEIALKKLLAGRSQYVVYGLYPGLAAAESMGIRDQIEPLQNSIISEGMYVAISKKSPCLKYKDHLSKKIQEYVKQGVPERLLEKYIKIWKVQDKLTKPEK